MRSNWTKVRVKDVVLFQQDVSSLSLEVSCSSFPVQVAIHYAFHGPDEKLLAHSIKLGSTPKNKRVKHYNLLIK
mgnify:CR=1 FL=1